MKTTKVPTQWARDMASVLQSTAEGLCNASDGSLTDLIIKKSTEEAMERAATITLMGIVRAFGTAGTGMPIIKLHGAAARNAILAWLGGGSKFVGGYLVLPLLAMGVAWLGWQLLRGDERELKELNRNERAMFNTCWSLSALLRSKAKWKRLPFQLTPKDIQALQMLRKRIRNYLRYGCRRPWYVRNHVRNRTEKNLEDMSKLLDKLR